MPPRKNYCKKYGELFSTTDAVVIELECISRNGRWINLEGGDCGKGLAFHVKALSQLIWPWVEWHRWNEELILPELCKVPHTRVALFGPASGTKTFTAGLFVNVMYAARPDNTTVLCSTTTREKLDLGIWADIKKLWREAKKKIPWWPGYLIDSKQQITTDGKGAEGREFRNGMVGRPCRRGSEWVGLSDYAGLKNDYMYLIADECFPAGTPVDTPSGPVPIEKILPGDLVYNCLGACPVKATSARPASSLVRITMRDGRKIVCTPNHGFLTQYGWQKAVDINCWHYILSGNETRWIMEQQKMSAVQAGLYTGSAKQSLLSKMPESEAQVCSLSETLRGTVPSFDAAFLYAELQRKMDSESTAISGRALYPGTLKKALRIAQKMVGRKPGISRSIVAPNEREQPEPTSDSFQETEGSPCGSNESTRNPKEVIGERQETRRELAGEVLCEDGANQSRGYAVGDVSERRGYLELCCSDAQRARQRLPVCLQNRHGISSHQTGSRSRRDLPQHITQCSPRCKENEAAKGSWVESCEVLKSEDLVPYRDGEGGITVYNLQVEGHHSYSVHGLSCLNCHLMADGFWKSCANLMSNENFTVCAIGNLNDLSTPLGEAAEPENGWDSIADTTKSRVYATRWHGGSTVQLVGEDSPNLDYPEGKEPFKKLIGRRFLKQCEHDYGKDTPLYNMFAAGKIPRGTLENRIITRHLCLQFHVFEPVIWGHQPLTKLYGADISYSAEHGDRTVGIPFAFGIDNEGKKRIAPIERPKVYGGDKPKWEKSDIPFEEQLAIDMKAECERLGIPPAHVFFDGTGRSSFTSALMRTWSTAVNAVEFGGSATERPNFMNRRYREGRNRGDLLQCRELFGKFVTELWFAGRHAIEFDQVRGMSEEVMKEAYFRLWFLTASNKIDAEPKKEMKLRLGRSPDLADAWVAGLEGARRLGFTIGSHDTIRPRNTKWLRDLRDQHEKELKSQELIYNA